MNALSKPIDPMMAQFVQSILIDGPVAKRLGIQLRSIEPERVVLYLPYDASNITVGSMVHGGVIATLIDIAGAAGSASGADSSKTTRGATTSLVVNYLNAANGVDLEAEATVIKRGRDMTVTEIAVRDPDKALIATGTVTSKLW
jgi:uncharacterized protein (TIGR00369 family)